MMQKSVSVINNLVYFALFSLTLVVLALVFKLAVDPTKPSIDGTPKSGIVCVNKDCSEYKVCRGNILETYFINRHSPGRHNVFPRHKVIRSEPISKECNS